MLFRSSVHDHASGDHSQVQPGLGTRATHHRCCGFVLNVGVAIVLGGSVFIVLGGGIFEHSACGSNDGSGVSSVGRCVHLRHLAGIDDRDANWRFELCE